MNKYKDEEGRPTKAWIDGAERKTEVCGTYVVTGNRYLNDKGLIQHGVHYWETKAEAKQALIAARWNFNQREKTKKARPAKPLDACVGECKIDFAANHKVDTDADIKPILVKPQRCVDALDLDPKASAAATKLPLQLLPPVFDAEVAKVLAVGAEKYGAWNWREKGVETMTYIGAMRRHLRLYLDGEDLDPEDDLSHLAHIAASVAILLDAENVGTLTDTRP